MAEQWTIKFYDKSPRCGGKKFYAETRCNVNNFDNDCLAVCLMNKIQKFKPVCSFSRPMAKNVAINFDANTENIFSEFLARRNAENFVKFVCKNCQYRIK